MNDEDIKVNKKIYIVLLIITIVLSCIIYYRLNNDPDRPIKYVETIKYQSKKIEYNNVSKYDGRILKNHEEYEKFKKEYNIEAQITKKDFNDNYYIIVFAENNYCNGKTNGIRSIEITDNEVKIDIGYNGSCNTCTPTYKLFIVPIEKDKINEKATVVSYKYTVENKYKCNEKK